MKILLTRPLEDAKATARAVQDAGHAALIAPVMKIVPDLDVTEESLDLDSTSGLVLTSANGLRAFVEKSDRRDFPVYAVGDASARLAKEAGFAHVHSAAGDVDALAALITHQHHERHKPLLHIAGKTVAGDLPGLLATQEIKMRRAVLYKAEPVDDLPIDIVAAFTHKSIDGVLLYSPRTARLFVDLIKNAMLTDEMAAVTVYCLSQAVADVVRAFPWKAIKIAEKPEESALLVLLDEGKIVVTDEKKNDEGKTLNEEGGVVKSPESPTFIPAATPVPDPEQKDVQIKDAGADKAAGKEEPVKVNPAASSVPKPASKPENKTSKSAATSVTRNTPSAVTVKKGPGVVTVAALALIGGFVGAAAFPLATPLLKQHVPQAIPFLPDDSITRSDLDKVIAQIDGKLSLEHEMGATIREDLQQGRETFAAKLNKTSDDVALLQGQIGNLPDQIRQLADRLAGIEGQEDPNYAAAIRVVEDMEARMRQVEASAAKAEAIAVTRIADQVQPYIADTRALDRRVAELQTSLRQMGATAQYGDRKAAIALAIGQLRRAVERGGRMDAELYTLRDLLTGLPDADGGRFDEPVATLAALDQRDIPNILAIQEAFDAADVSPVFVAEEELPTWLGALSKQFASLVTIRRISAETGDVDDRELQILAARKALLAGNLQDAVSALPADEAAFADWRALAEMRLRAIVAVDQLEAIATSLLATRQTGDE